MSLPLKWEDTVRCDAKGQMKANALPVFWDISMAA